MKYPFQPEVLDALPEELAELFRGLEDTLLDEICSRLAMKDQLNEVTVQAIRALRSHGIDTKEIEKAIRKTSGISEKKLKELGIKVKSRPVELGYEIRCQTPIAYDLTYCSELGIGVHKLFAEGKTGCMVYVDSEGNVSPLYLKDLQDPTTGKIPPRLVDIKSDKFTSVVETILNAITPADYEAAKAYVPNPEEYDFHKILNWK